MGVRAKQVERAAANVLARDGGTSEMNGLHRRVEKQEAEGRARVCACEKWEGISFSCLASLGSAA